MDNNKLFLDILNSREERANKQIEILKEHQYPLISFTLNIPGINKCSDNYKRIHKEGVKRIINLLEDEQIEIKHKESYDKSTGPEGYISADIDPKELKRLMISLENAHPLGRIFDIDIFDKDHNQIGRSDIDEESRKCLICKKDAKICIREKNHSYEELIERIDEMSKEYFGSI